MTDLHARLLLYSNPAEFSCGNVLPGLLKEAAAEIERLRAELYAEREHCASICDRLAAESSGMFAFGASKCAEAIREGLHA